MLFFYSHTVFFFKIFIHVFIIIIIIIINYVVF